MAGNYHTARTLDKGTSQVGMTFSSTTYEVPDENDNTVARFTLPNLIPELTYHIGVADNVEVGGRAALGSFGLELDAKWRFFQSDKLHLAIAPALGYQGLVIVQGTTVRLPGILTYELNEHFAFNMAVFGSSTKWEPVDTDSDFDNFNGTLGATGAAFGFDIRGETLSIRPAVEFTRYVADFSNGDSFEPFNTINLLIHVAFTGGREKQQLDRIERKLDQMNGGGAPAGGAPGSY